MHWGGGNEEDGVSSRRVPTGKEAWTGIATDSQLSAGRMVTEHVLFWKLAGDKAGAGWWRSQESAKSPICCCG